MYYTVNLLYVFTPIQVYTLTTTFVESKLDTVITIIIILCDQLLVLVLLVFRLLVCMVMVIILIYDVIMLSLIFVTYN